MRHTGRRILRRSLPTFLLLLHLLPLYAQRDSTASALRIHGVTITGNKVTREPIILRELLVREGESLGLADFYERTERSRQNLMNTGLFNTVTVLPLFLNATSVIVEVVVNERWYWWPGLIFQLADPNFNTWWLTRDLDRVNYGVRSYRYNFRGRNETLHAVAQFGYTQQFALQYKVPYVDRRQRWGITVGGGFEQQAEVTSGTVDNKRILLRNPDGPNRTERWGSLELTLRRAHDIRHYWRAGYMDAEVTDTVVQRSADYFDGDALRTRYFSLGYGLVWDRRDNRAFPRKGHYAEVRIDRWGLGVGGEAEPDITTLYATAKRWWVLGERWTAALSLRGRVTQGTPPYYVQEGLGYSAQVRGYEYYVADGEHFTMGRANVLFTLFRPRSYRLEAVPMESFRTLHLALYLNVYTDVGRVWDSRYAAQNSLSDQWQRGHGLGVDLVTSYDQVVRFEYSINALGEHGSFLHFTQPF
jgi:outer membrane protein assembly factor BamA